MALRVQLLISARQIPVMPVDNVAAIIQYPVYPMDLLAQMPISAIQIPVMNAVYVMVMVLLLVPATAQVM
tara:strand:- start:377 stop:586 length:210 start_codon:yes stop_codon:yes gene_type:complete